MPKFSIFYDIEIAGKKGSIPNKPNPVEAESLKFVIDQIAEKFDYPDEAFGEKITYKGIHITDETIS